MMRMAQGILLTDDEIVALAAMLGRPWPIGLATAAPTAGELTRAGARGVRSLVIRGIVTVGADSGYTPHPGIAAIVETFIRAPRRVGAYIAPAAAVDTMAGASITAVPVAGIWWVDSATAQGIHGFRQADRDEVVGAIADLADQTCDGTLLAGVDDPSAYVCVVVHGDDSAKRTVVTNDSAGAGSRESLSEALDEAVA